jgi:hypothetical protein
MLHFCLTFAMFWWHGYFLLAALPSRCRSRHSQLFHDEPIELISELTLKDWATALGRLLIHEYMLLFYLTFAMF